MITAGKQRSVIWHEDEAFWLAMAPLFFGPAQWDAAAEEAERAAALLGLEAGASILDLACGPGRHALALARQGFHVTGVDRTAAFIEEAARRAAADALAAEFVQADMRRFRRSASFDGVISLSTSFGYFEDPRDDRAVIANLFHSLKDGCRLVLQMMGQETAARDFQAQERYPGPDGTTIVETRSIGHGGSWFQKRRCIVDGDRVVAEFHVSHRLYSEAAITSLLAACGFRDVTICGDLSRAPYDRDAQELVATARK